MPAVGGCRTDAGHGRRRGGDDAGYSIIEAVITLPVLIMFTMLVVQYALVWHSRHIAQAAAQDGLRAARGYASSAADGQDAATTYLRQVAPNLLTGPLVVADRTPTTVTVVVHAHVLSVVPFADFDVDERVSGPVERFVQPVAGR